MLMHISTNESKEVTRWVGMRPKGKISQSLARKFIFENTALRLETFRRMGFVHHVYAICNTKTNDTWAIARIPDNVGNCLVEEKYHKENFRVLSEMRILAKIRVVVLDFCRVCRNFNEMWCKIGF